jgi:drug/metabolite transporter (DMT)-like permease
VADWLTPRSKHKLSFWQINLMVNLAGVICYLLLFVATLPHHMLAQDVFLKAFLGSALLCTGYVFFVKALTIGPVGVVVPLSNVYPLITLVLSIIFLNEVFTHLQIFAIVIILLGAILLAYEKNHQKLPLRSLHRANIFTLIAVIIWGLAYFVLNPLFTKDNWQIMLLILDATGVSIATILMIFAYKRKALEAAKNALSTGKAWLAGLLLVVGTAAIYWGAGQVGDVIVPTVISALSPLLAAGLEAVVDKKRLSLLKYAGALTAVAGIILINL